VAPTCELEHQVEGNVVRFCDALEQGFRIGRMHIRGRVRARRANRTGSLLATPCRRCRELVNAAAHLERPVVSDPIGRVATDRAEPLCVVHSCDLLVGYRGADETSDDSLRFLHDTKLATEFREPATTTIGEVALRSALRNTNCA